MTSHGMTSSSQCSWPIWSRPVQQDNIAGSVHSDASCGFDVAPQHFRSSDLLAAKMASFGRRIREMVSAGVGGELVSSVCAAYNRWSAAVETDRRRGRTYYSSAQPHDDVHTWLIDILDAALHQSSVSTSDLGAALSLTAVNTTPSSNVSVMDVQTLLQRVTHSLPPSQQQLTGNTVVRRTQYFFVYFAFGRELLSRQKFKTKNKSCSLLKVNHDFCP